MKAEPCSPGEIGCLLRQFFADIGQILKKPYEYGIGFPDPAADPVRWKSEIRFDKISAGEVF